MGVSHFHFFPYIHHGFFDEEPPRLLIAGESPMRYSTSLTSEWRDPLVLVPYCARRGGWITLVATCPSYLITTELE
jgi:hypothetical protein